MKQWLNLVCVKIWRILHERSQRNKKNNLCCCSDQTYDTCYLNCCMLSHLIQFSLPEKGKVNHEIFSQQHKQLTLPKPSRLKNISFQILRFSFFFFFFFFQFSMFQTRKSGSRKILWIRILIYVAIVIKLMKYFIRFLTSWLLSLDLVTLKMGSLVVHRFDEYEKESTLSKWSNLWNISFKLLHFKLFYSV